MLSLEQIMQGCVRKLRIRKIISDSSGNEKEEDSILEVKVPPGTVAGTRFTFEREGDQRPGIIPADLVFIAQDRPHQVFQRNGSNIEYTAQISDKQVENRSKIQIPTLEGDSVEITLDKSTVGTLKRLPNRGLPLSNEQSIKDKRGDLIVHFKVTKEVESGEC